MRLTVFLLACAWCAFLISSQAMAQNIQYNEKSADLGLRSDFRVNPSTRAVEIQIPLGSYPGRAGVNVPLAMSYSSKVWRVAYNAYAPGPYSSSGQPIGPGYVIAPAMYGEHSRAGWTSSTSYLGTDNSPANEIYDINGSPKSGSNCETGCYIIDRILVRMPDGSTHELRSSDQPIQTPNSAPLPDDLYAVDGSRLRYQRSTGTLFMPDGSRYVGNQYIDRNGNKLDYAISGVGVIDTLGRTIAHPPLSSTAGDFTYTPLGMGGSYIFKWRTLGTAGVLTTSQPLHYTANSRCPPGTGNYSPYLFGSTSDTCIANADALFNPVVLHQVVLPTGRAYTFTYNVYGEIDKVQLPTGGYERYEYAQILPISSMTHPYVQANRGVVKRWVSATGLAAGEVLWQYGNLGTSGTVTILAPDGSLTERYLHTDSGTNSFGYSAGGSRAGMAYDERQYSAPDASGTRQMLLRKLTEWTMTGSNASNQFAQQANRNPRIVKEVEILLDTGSSNALAKTTTYAYDTTYQFTVGVDETSKSEYAFVSVAQSTAQTGAIGSIPLGTLLRTTQTAYSTGDANYRARNLLGLPTSSTIQNAAGTTVAQTTMDYDEAAYPLLPGGATTGWTNPATTVRGNVTTMSRWLNTTGGWLETHVQYDVHGNTRKMWDAAGNVSEVEFASTYQYAYPTRSISPVPDPTGTYGSTAALITTNTYNFNTGVLASTTNANGDTTTYSYADDNGVADPLNRLRKVTHPAGNGYTKFVYGVGANAGFNNHYIQTTTALDTTRVMTSYKYFDGLGRSARAYQYEGSAWLVSDTQYDDVGRMWRVSNPYRATALGSTINPSGAWTTNSYDGLSRILTVTTSDGAQMTTTYSGNQVTVADATGRARRSVTDSLGRLTQVVEDPTGLAYQTNYSYDTLGNLHTVAQSTQRRYFMYDSLSRLIRAKNPEQIANASIALADSVSGNSQWSLAYTYDNNDNLITKKDARNITSTYTYDDLNRNTLINYSMGTRIVRYYDTATNGIGQLSASYFYIDSGTNAGANSLTAIDSYDLMGQPLSQRQQFYSGGAWSAAYVTQRTYNLAGGVVSQTYPSGRVANYTYDLAGRATGFTGNLGDGVTRNYATTITYDVWGGLSRERFGTTVPLYHKERRNARGQLYDMRLSTVDDVENWNRGAIVNYYSFQPYGIGTSGPDNNGNLLVQQHWVPNDDAITSSQFMQQNYDYDALNRQTWMAEYPNGVAANSNGGQTSVYDRYGNRTIDPGSWGIGINNKQFTVNATNNRLGVPAGQTGVMTYDNTGNLINDTYSGTGARTYDAENRMVTAGTGAQQNVYTYDADGHRVRRKIAGQETWQVYGMDGEIVAEYAANAAASSPQKEYGYRNGQLLVTAASGADVRWLVSDQLGTPRMIADKTGALAGIRRHDYLPFGEEMFAGTGNRTAQQGYQSNDGVRQQFTQKERDNESGLDYFIARYYSSTQGRFTSVDPENADADMEMPQSWNAYAYARNNPQLYTDPTGKEITICGPDGKNCYTHTNKDFANVRQHCQDTGDCTIVDDRRTGGRIIQNGVVIATFSNELDGTPGGQLIEEMNKPENWDRAALSGIIRVAVRGVLNIFGRNSSSTKPSVRSTGFTSNALKQALSRARPVGDRLEATLDDGTKVIFRKDFGPKSHPIGSKYPQPVDHYNVEIHSPINGRPGRFSQEMDVHIVVDKSGNVIDIIK